MDSASTHSVADAVVDLTRRNGWQDAAAMPILAISPFQEVLLNDVARMLPPELAEPLARAETPAQVNDCIAAGVMYRWLEDDAYLRRLFVGHLTEGPRQAALILVRTVAARLDPPERGAEWRTADVRGLWLQLGVVLAFLAIRVLLASVALAYAAGTALPSPVAVFGAVIDLPVLTLGGIQETWAAAFLTAIACWHAVEARCAPRLFEWARRLPARLRTLPLPLPWRVEAFRIVWCLQAAMLWAAVSASAGMRVLPVVSAADPTSWRAAGVLVLIAVLLRSARSISKAIREAFAA